MRYRISWVLAWTALVVLAPEAHAQWLFNLDVCQTFSQPQDNFEVCVQGDYSQLPLDWGVYKPSNWTVQKSYNASRNETCFSFAGPALPQQSSSDRPWHFGVGIGRANLAQVKSVYWTRGPLPSIKPGTSCNVFSGSSGLATFQVSNDTENAVVLDQVAFQFFPTFQDLTTMNRDGMPPSSLQSAPVAPGMSLAPGQAYSFTVPEPQNFVPASAVCFVTSRFPADVLPSPPPNCPVGTSIWTQEPVTFSATQP